MGSTNVLLRHLLWTDNRYLPSMYIDLVLTTAIDLVFDFMTILVVVSAFTGYGNMCSEH
jgi:hypothetical protein